ncbi:MAG TPA: penicillin-binding transpeptidase domain-containing protein [Solirubrobacteraceae bacterium]|nr:penicillin-binding transpeptidase domain-containing protein [Solirubrobacteraceae bacterium]
MTENRPQRLRRARPVLALAAVAFAIGAVVGAQAGPSPSDALAERFVHAWTRGDYTTMYAALDPASRRSTSAGEFAAAYEEDLTTATAGSTRVVGRARGEAEGRVVVPVHVETRLFGPLSLDFTLKIGEAGGEGPRVSWSRSQAFPGLLPGEQLSRHTALPERASLLARDGSVLAEGPPGDAVAPPSGETTRSSPLGEAMSSVTGTVGAIPPSRRQALAAQGVPGDALVGLSGLERALDERLRGSPGGELLAGSRVLAVAAPRQAAATRTSISPTLQRAAVAALGGQYGGVVALQPATGQILAVAGIGLDGLQPPGSTFKMVTVTGVLAAGVATPSTVFPYATYALLDGVKLSNANGEECGGTLETAFAVSCNSVFTPLGVKLGAARLVAAAEAYGFNHETGLPGAAESTLPVASQIQGELDIGSTAIGQGQVLATPLQMAMVASTIGDGGRRPQPTFLADAHPTFVARASSSGVARTVRRLMIGVVRSGTGTAAAIPGVVVAGKTGTAELKTPCTPSASAESASSEASAKECQGSESEASNTDAWFAAFAPALHPRIAVCVMLVKDGAGGATAAPVARQVLEAGLQAGL